MQFKTSNNFVDYPSALSEMEATVADIIAGKGQDTVWFLEHPSLYTAGTSAKITDLKDPEKFPVFDAGRGGQYTYHGPGQRIAYIMLNLKNYQETPDLRAFVYNVEEVIIKTLAHFGLEGFRREGRVGIWVNKINKSSGRPEEAKIAAIGIRVRKFVTFHGLSINLNPELGNFDGIVPCGLPQFGVTSLYDMGLNVSMAELDAALATSFEAVFKRI